MIMVSESAIVELVVIMQQPYFRDSEFDLNVHLYCTSRAGLVNEMTARLPHAQR
jgi:hypothetical protein